MVADHKTGSHGVISSNSTGKSGSLNVTRSQTQQNRKMGNNVFNAQEHKSPTKLLQTPTGKTHNRGNSSQTAVRSALSWVAEQVVALCIVVRSPEPGNPGSSEMAAVVTVKVVVENVQADHSTGNVPVMVGKGSRTQEKV